MIEDALARLQPQERTELEILLLLRACKGDPEAFFTEVLRVKCLRRWQRRACARIKAAIEEEQVTIKILIRACHGAGKTFFLAGILLWIMSCYEDSRALTTAPTWAGVENLLWPEIAGLYKQSCLKTLGFGRMLTTKLDVRDTWYAVGASSDRPEHLEGHHSKTCALRIVDEAKAVESKIYTATDGMLNAPLNFDCWISTPSIQAGDFYDRDVSLDRSVIREVVDVNELLTDPFLTAGEHAGYESWRAGAEVKYGIESDEYRTRVMAQYADSAEGALFPSSWLERASLSDWTIKQGSYRAGMDVAGSDDGDQNAVAVAHVENVAANARIHVVSLSAWHEKDTMKSKGRALSIAREFSAPIRVDVQGLGKGVYDQLRQEQYAATEYRAGSSPTERGKVDFSNCKAEDSWELRRKLEFSLLRLPDNPEMLMQMRKMKYEILPNGKKKVVDPPDSPDLFDAVLIACARPRTGSFLMAEGPAIRDRSREEDDEDQPMRRGAYG